MEQKKLAAGVLAIVVILLVAGRGGVFAFAPDANSVHGIAAINRYAHVSGEGGMPYSARGYGHDVRELVQPESSWQQVNANGFGTQNATEVSAVEAFNGYLYAGTDNVTDRARIFRSPDAVTWTPVIDPGFGIPHDTAPPAILDLAIFNGRLYASTGRGGNPGQIWRTLNGTIWAPMVIAGFSDPDTTDITALAVYGGLIYAGATNQVNGAQIWRSFTGDNNSWTQVAPAVPGTAAATITGFAVFDGALYAVVESEAPAQIWRSYGGDWTTIMSDGFGNSLTTMTGGMAEFAGYLYVGAGNTASGAQLWRTNDGASWEPAISPGFGDANNVKVESVFVFQNDLYASVQNAVTGMEIWRTADGTLWEQANQDGFGDGNNTGSNWRNATAAFQARLYVGTSNVVDGGELWEMTPDAFYDLVLSPDDSLAGLPGETVTYTLTISNSGTVSDTYGLAIAGNSWTTSLSTATISLAPGVAGQFDVSVSIPAGALATDSDTASITATSQGDGTKSATTHLTTTVLPVYGVTLSPDDSLSGLPGETVTYTLTISNSGIMADVYSLAIAGNSWTTALSSSGSALAPGASGQFDVSVSIPAGAAGNATDVVTVTATSQGDNTVSDIAVLTTTCTAPGQALYLPLILQFP